MKKVGLLWSSPLLMLLGVQFSAPAMGADPAPVAMTTDVQGNAWLLDGGKQTRLSLMNYLVAGSRLRLDAGARVSVTYFAVPREFVVSGPAQSIVDAEQLRVVSGAPARMKNLDQNQVAAGQKLSARQRERVTVATFEMKAFQPGNLQLHQPVDTRLLGVPEEFSWRTLPGAKSYRFRLSDGDGKLLYSGELPTPRLRLPDSVKLELGRSYSWSIEAQAVSGLVQSASAGFSLLDAPAVRAIVAQRPTTEASFSERLLYASLLEEAGLKLDASAYWKTLARERPDDEMLQDLANR